MGKKDLVARVVELTARLAETRKGLERIAAHYTDTGLAAQHMASIARLTLNNEAKLRREALVQTSGNKEQPK